MKVAESIKIDPVSALVQELVSTLFERAQGLYWRSTEQGLAADIAEGQLLLSALPEWSAWKLTVIFHAHPEGTDLSTPVERGRRVVGWGSLGRMQQRAIELAMYGVPGGPTYTGGPLTWHRVEWDESWRLAVPSGELRILPLDGDLCTLTHEDGKRVELLSLGTREELERQALPLCLTRATRPLQIRVKGRRVNLRSVGVAGVLGYHELDDGSSIVLAVVCGDIVLLHARGAFHRLLATLSWTDLMFGDPIDVRGIGHSERHVAPDGISRPSSGLLRDAFPADPAANFPPTVVPSTDKVSVAPRPAVSPTMPRPVAAHTPMNERHRELCRRYFRRLYRRLTGRGARKARELVLLLSEMLDVCRDDITGSRLEIHACLEQALAQRLPGGPRNIRDCIDLLARNSPFARAEAGKRCTLLFGQLHDPDSSLMSWIAADDAREELAANSASAPLEVPDSAQKTSPAAPVVAPAARSMAGAPHDLDAIAEPRVAELVQPHWTTSPQSPTSIRHEPEPQPCESQDGMLVEVYRCLGAAPMEHLRPGAAPPDATNEPTVEPPAPSATSPSMRPLAFAPGGLQPSPHALRGFVRRGTYFLGQLVNDDDDEDAPSRFRGRSGDQTEPSPGDRKPK